VQVVFEEILEIFEEPFDWFFKNHIKQTDDTE